MKLRPISYLVLGMVRLGARSGYAIKKATDMSTRAFFPTSLAQVYPELARLEEGGMLTRREDPHGRRSRAAYELTAKGEQALATWLRSGRQAPTHLRDEGLLRLFLADALPLEERIELVQRMRARALAAEQWMQEDVLPTAQALQQSGSAGPATVAQLGIDTYGFLADRLERLAEELGGVPEEGLEPPTADHDAARPR